MDIAYEKGLLANEEMDKLLGMDSSYERNVYLKEAISKKLASSVNGKEADYFNWIVKVWGGIRTYSKSPEYVRKCINTLLNDNYLTFDGIASMSKIVSFMFPDKYIIYDARVCYSLNWILLKNKASNKYFPVPESRNTKLNAFDIDVIIRLANMENYQVSQTVNPTSRTFINQRDKSLYITQEEAYITMCDLINIINKELWDDNDRRKVFPFYTEMILFAIAVEEIFIDIANSCKLEVGC